MTYLPATHSDRVLLEATGSIGGVARAFRKSNAQRPRLASWRGAREPGYARAQRTHHRPARKPKEKK